MRERSKVIREARCRANEVSLLDLLSPRDSATSVLSDKVPEWLEDELACEGVRIYSEKHGALDALTMRRDRIARRYGL